jgi:hypothetical protein
MEDIVPSVPFPLMGGERYAHSGIMIPFSVNLSHVAKNHSDAYSSYFNED